jgi:hypothetical protein
VCQLDLRKMCLVTLLLEGPAAEVQQKEKTLLDIGIVQSFLDQARVFYVDILTCSRHRPYR